MAKKKKTVTPAIIRSNKVIKKPSRRKKNKFLKNLVNYLTSDSYMYQPIVSSQIICSPPPPTHTPTTDACYETEKSTSNLLKKIVEYLKSDSFMYAPLSSPPASAYEAPACPSKRVPTEEVVVTAEITKKVAQPVDKTVDVFGAHEVWNDNAFERSSILRRTRMTTKHLSQNN